MKQIKFLLSLLLFTTFAFSQEANTIDQQGLLYSNFFTAGLQVHSNGWGINLRKGIDPNIKWNRFYELEVVNMKHSKEIKIYHPFYDNVKGYVYGKKNVFVPVRFGYGFERLITGKTNRNSVAIQFVSSAGLSAGFLKPVYLEILKESTIPDTYYIVIEKYDPSEHRIDNIYSRASFTHGLSEMSITPGAYTKLGFNFDYNNQDDRLTSLEAGVVIDYYYKDVPIMDSEINTSLFLTFYISITYGLKWN